MNTKEAKDFLADQAAQQAALEHIPISDLEKRMMYFTESDPASCGDPDSLHRMSSTTTKYDTPESRSGDKSLRLLRLLRIKTLKQEIQDGFIVTKRFLRMNKPIIRICNANWATFSRCRRPTDGTRDRGRLFAVRHDRQGSHCCWRLGHESPYSRTNRPDRLARDVCPCLLLGDYGEALLATANEYRLEIARQRSILKVTS